MELCAHWKLRGCSICFGKVLKWLSKCLSIYPMNGGVQRIGWNRTWILNIFCSVNITEHSLGDGSFLYFLVASDISNSNAKDPMQWFNSQSISIISYSGSGAFDCEGVFFAKSYYSLFRIWFGRLFRVYDSQINYFFAFHIIFDKFLIPMATDLS